MRLEEIKQQYPGEWVLIEFTKLDDELKVVDGNVIAHSPSRDEIENKLLGVKTSHIAVEYTGEEDTGEAFLICANLIVQCHPWPAFALAPV